MSDSHKFTECPKTGPGPIPVQQPPKPQKEQPKKKEEVKQNPKKKDKK